METLQLHHGWGSHQPQTASHIHTRHTQVFEPMACCLTGILVHPYTVTQADSTWDFWFFLSFVEGKWFNYIMVEADIHLRLCLISILDTYKLFEVMVCCLTGIWVHPYIITEDGWSQILQFWVMQLHDGWSWHPTKTAAHIDIRHIQSVWGIGMPPHGHMDAPLYRSTSQVGHRFWNFRSFVEGKWCNFIMAEADITSDCIPHRY